MKILVLEDQHVGEVHGTPQNRASGLIERLRQDGHTVFLFDGGKIERHAPNVPSSVVRTWDGGSATVEDLLSWVAVNLAKEIEVGFVIDFQIRTKTDFGQEFWFRIRDDHDRKYNVRPTVLSKSIGATNRDKWAKILHIHVDRIFARGMKSSESIAAVMALNSGAK